MLELYDEGWGFRRLAKKFDISKSQVRRICLGLHRGQTAERFKDVPAMVLQRLGGAFQFS